MTTRRRGSVMGLVAALVIGHAAAGDAVDFTWNQSGGFAIGTSSLTGGPLGPGTFPGPANAGHGGLEFFGLQTSPPAPAGTYRSISWGCVADGDNSGGVTGCANGGTVGETVVGADPTGTPGRSSLVFTPFNNTTSPTPGTVGPFTFSADGTLRDDGLWVVAQRLDHLNRIIDNEGNYLNGISTQTNLTINAVPVFADAVNTVPITFTETLNEVPAGACDGTNPLGSACDDVFTFDASDYDNQAFASNGIPYLLEFNLSPVPECSTVASTVGTLTVYQCSDSPDHRVAIDFASGLAYAQEGFDNAFMVVMRITAIPVPASLALLVGGLVGVGLLGWKGRTPA